MTVDPKPSFDENEPTEVTLMIPDAEAPEMELFATDKAANDNVYLAPAA